MRKKNKRVIHLKDDFIKGTIKIVSDIDVKEPPPFTEERVFTIELEIYESEIKDGLKDLSERDEYGGVKDISDDVYDEFVKELSWGYIGTYLKRKLIEMTSNTLCMEDKMIPNYRVLKEWNKKDSGYHPVHKKLFELGKLNGLKVERKPSDVDKDEKRKVIKEGKVKMEKISLKEIFSERIIDSSFHSNGQIRYQETLGGRIREWYENGTKKREYTLKNGKKDGLWTEWYEDGVKKWSEKTYKDGKLTGWYRNGKKIGKKVSL